MSITAIDESKLDLEWLDHPPLVEEWAEKKADADHAVKAAADRLSLVKCETRLRVRKRPSKFNLPDGFTKDDVDATVECSERYQKALAELRQAEREAGHYKAMMEALDHRRTSMSKTVELWQMGVRTPRMSGRKTRHGLNGRRGE